MVFSTAALLCIAAVRSNPETNPSAMLICYAQENRNRWFVSILLWPVHSDQSLGFLQGASPSISTLAVFAVIWRRLSLSADGGIT
jgi:hypothetical protein